MPRYNVFRHGQTKKLGTIEADSEDKARDVVAGLRGIHPRDLYAERVRERREMKCFLCNLPFTGVWRESYQHNPDYIQCPVCKARRVVEDRRRDYENAIERCNKLVTARNIRLGITPKESK